VPVGGWSFGVTLLACGMLPALAIDGWVPQAAMAALFKHSSWLCFVFAVCLLMQKVLLLLPACWM
jgi:hypothetical protein